MRIATFFRSIISDRVRETTTIHDERRVLHASAEEASCRGEDEGAQGSVQEGRQGRGRGAEPGMHKTHTFTSK